jgi:hypothetical protein
MTGNYLGHYRFDLSSILAMNSEVMGVYYIGQIDVNTNKLIVHYVGRAAGSTIRQRLYCHLREDQWPDAWHFGYIACSTSEDAISLEVQETIRLRPKYNKRVG